MKMRIVLPWPSAALSPNFRSRTHWARTGALKKARLDGKLAAMSAMRVAKWRTVKSAVVRAALCFTRAARRDGDNFLAMLKPYLDGFADAGVIANDSGFRHEPVTFVRSSEKCVVVEIECDVP